MSNKFSSFLPEQLQAERERRQREIGALESKLSQLEEYMQRIQDEWKEAFDNACEEPGGVGRFEAGGYQAAEASCTSQIGAVQAKIDTLKTEMSDIEHALRIKRL